MGNKFNLLFNYRLKKQKQNGGEKNMKLINNKKGFTLVELLLVMAIIGILASIIFISIGSARKRARITTFKESMKNIAVAATQCTDIGGTIDGENANGSEALCSIGTIGDIPLIKECNGSLNPIGIEANPNSGDDFEIVAECPISDSANCTATCTANGCVFDDTEDDASDNDNCPNT